tara:strand:+ start:1362 stop:1958 length:597 start_codon:yes stop_codon:yes gene_type:complete
MPITLNGSGTVSGISAGGLPDGIIQSADLATGVGGKIVHYENIIWNTHTSIAAITSRPELSSSLRFTYTPTLATSKIILRYNLRMSSLNIVTMFFVGKDVSSYSDLQNTEFVNSPASFTGGPSSTGGDDGNAANYGGNSTNGEMRQISLMATEPAGNTNQRIYSVHCKVTSGGSAHFNRWTNTSYYGTSFAELFEVAS